MAATAAGVLLTTGLAACAPGEQSDDSSVGRPTPYAVPHGDRGERDRRRRRPTAEPTKGVGPRTGALRSADILVFSKTTLTDDIVERIRKVKGVRSVEPLSMAQVSIENRAINLAAVDPATLPQLHAGRERRPPGAVGPGRRRPARRSRRS